MKHENPISIVRKAITVSAENQASKEFLDKPEKRHYKKALDFYRFIKFSKPETYQKLINIGAESKDLIDETGRKLFKIFDQVWQELNQRDNPKVTEGINRIKERQLQPKEESKEIIALHERVLKQEKIELQNDPRLKQAFLGQDALLNKNIDFAIAITLELLSDFARNPTELRELKSEEIDNLFYKIRKFFRKSD